MNTKVHNESLDETLLAAKPSSRKRSKRNQNQKFSVNLKKNISLIGYSILAIFTFIFILLLKLPLNSLSGHALALLSAQTQLDWDAKESRASIILGPKIIFRELTISVPSHQRMNPDNTMNKFLGDGLRVEELSFRPSLLELIPIPWLKESRTAGSFDISAVDSKISGSFALGAKSLYLDINIAGLNLKNIEALKKIIDIDGKVQNAHIVLSAPYSRLTTANGEITLMADQLKLDPTVLSNASFVRSIGILNLGKLQIHSRIKNGTMNIQDCTLSGKDADIDLKVEGDLHLNDMIAYSDMNLMLTLTPGLKLKPLMENPLILGLIPFDKKPNNSYGLRIQGNLNNIRTSPYKGGG